jgi:RNA polymerase sigma-70 factor (ECF subfamily)
MDPVPTEQAPSVDAETAQGPSAARQQASASVRPAAAPLASFRALFDREISYVWCSLRRLGVPDKDREDLANEVFFRVYQRLHEYDPARPLRPWLFAFSVRVASEHRRRASNRFEELGGGDDAALDAIAPPTPNAEDAELVSAALERLDMDKRAVLVLHDLDGNTVPEIALALDIPEGTAYSRLRAAREQITATLRRLRVASGSGR